VAQLRNLLYGYYSQMSLSFSSSNVTPDTISSQTVHDDILLSHLVYKSLVKIAVWLWNKTSKMTPEEYDENLTWVLIRVITSSMALMHLN